MSKDTQLKAGERAFNGLLLLFSLGILYEAYQIAGLASINSPGAFPIMLGLIMTGSMLAILWGQRHHPKPDTRGALDEARQFTRQHFPLPIVVFSAMAIGYLVLLQLVGFLIATVLFLFVSQVYLRRGRWLASALITLGATAIIYALFKLLFQVYLP
ncbi:tripartite tricarboxylate transporter TctB family protein [Modicisalibacter radicis]|uniref:tripartite tricarboxylate transporter TctB family protein n=1 Tax=Halomonas sp. EAR18 TaxID=2518972 RepID=UPI00109CFA37|nr:tripartite tricarboxylate transporter TctB family protein [Halomonas sp. EAR18]